MKTLAPFALAAFLIAGCAAQRPVLYPTGAVPTDPMAADIQDREITDCQRLADANVRSTVAPEAVRETALGGAIGAASGVVGGAIFGSPGTGAAVGAASGATAGLLGSLFRSNVPNPTYQSYVNTCLADHGYRVVGWQ